MRNVKIITQKNLLIKLFIGKMSVFFNLNDCDSFSNVNAKIWILILMRGFNGWNQNSPDIFLQIIDIHELKLETYHAQIECA